ALEVQRLEARFIAYQRHSRFREALPHMVAGVVAEDWRADTGQVGRDELLIRAELRRFAAVPGAEHHPHALVGRRQLDSLQVAVDKRVEDVLLPIAQQEPGR